MSDSATKEAVRQNAERAKMLLTDSILPEMFAKVEQGYIGKMLAPDATDDDRRRYSDRVNALRDVIRELETTISAAAKPRDLGNLP